MVAAGVVSLLGPGAAAGTADGCSFDAATGTVTASVSGFFPEKARGNTMSVDGGAILFEGTPCGGATTTNTDSIVVTGSPGQDVFVVDMRSGPFAPGATPDPDGSPEIELRLDLGGGADLLRLFATRGPDRIRSAPRPSTWTATPPPTSPWRGREAWSCSRSGATTW